jgi:hypothetical protein
MDTPTIKPGWIGDRQLIIELLHQRGADLEPSGEPRLSQSIIMGMDYQECLISPDVMYYIDGAPQPLSAHLAEVGGTVVPGLILY